MKSQVFATLVDGMIKPDTFLNLPNHSRVSVTIELAEERSTPLAAWESLQRRLEARPVHAAGQRYSRDELQERD